MASVLVLAITVSSVYLLAAVVPVCCTIAPVHFKIVESCKMEIYR